MWPASKKYEKKYRNKEKKKLTISTRISFAPNLVTKKQKQHDFLYWEFNDQPDNDAHG